MDAGAVIIYRPNKRNHIYQAIYLQPNNFWRLTGGGGSSGTISPPLPGVTRGIYKIEVYPHRSRSIYSIYLGRHRGNSDNSRVACHLGNRDGKGGEGRGIPLNLSDSKTLSQASGFRHSMYFMYPRRLWLWGVYSGIFGCSGTYFLPEVTDLG